MIKWCTILFNLSVVEGLSDEDEVEENRRVTHDQQQQIDNDPQILEGDEQQDYVVRFAGERRRA